MRKEKPGRNTQNYFWRKYLVSGFYFNRSNKAVNL